MATFCPDSLSRAELEKYNKQTNRCQKRICAREFYTLTRPSRTLPHRYTRVQSSVGRHQTPDHELSRAEVSRERPSANNTCWAKFYALRSHPAMEDIGSKVIHMLPHVKFNFPPVARAPSPGRPLTHDLIPYRMFGWVHVNKAVRINKWIGEELNWTRCVKVERHGEEKVSRLHIRRVPQALQLCSLPSASCQPRRTHFQGTWRYTCASFYGV